MMNSESFCKHCGRCCELKEQVGKYYKLTGKMCEHFIRTGPDKGYCNIYQNREGIRLEIENVCVPLKFAIMYGDLPPDCPYARLIPYYKTRVIDWMETQN